jgi:hypothetical protein
MSEKVIVVERDSSKKNSPISDQPDPGQGEGPDRGSSCYWDDAEYSHCTEIIKQGKTFHCYNGSWHWKL